MEHPVQELSLGSFPWEWRKAASSSDDWTKCKTFPTVIHFELEQAGQIPDPFIGDNENDLQWVGLEDWEFRTRFPTPQGFNHFRSVVLSFDGLDTVAKVFLNDQVILQNDNMFVPLQVDVSAALKEGEMNDLRILFESADRVAKEREAVYGKLDSTIRDGSRLHLRKAQYHWGWDWGPKEVTCGPYKDIKLRLYDQEIDDIHVTTELTDDLSTATVSVEVALAEAASDGRVEVSLESQDGKTLEQKIMNISKGSDTMLFTVPNPQLWWPAGHGDPNLHQAVVKLLSRDGKDIQTKSIAFGIREIKLIQRPLDGAEGTTFMFQVNKKPIYICGNNWVPSHNQTPAVTTQMYSDMLSLAVRNNNNMIRLWGGGYFEHDDFYNICDQKGLLVWHDFMTACGIYPVNKSFLESVAIEVRAQVKRLRNHACIALWCGNNEDLFCAENNGVEFDASDVTGPWDKTPLPQRIIYLQIWPEIIRELTPEIPYWPSSPFGGKNSNDPTVGDVHQWNVWHMQQLHYQQFPQLGGRFVSEFGMHAFPDIRTVKAFAPNQADRFPNSRMMDTHNKSHGAESKMGKYLWSNFHLPRTMESFIYVSQLLQAEALDYAIIHWRREWKGESREYNAGSINWQLNDSNPTTSWALVDYYHRRKPAFYTSARAFAPVSVGITRTPFWHFVDNDNPITTHIPRYELWGSSFLNNPIALELRVRAYDIAHLKEISLDPALAVSQVTLGSNKSTELLNIPDSDMRRFGVTESSYIVLSATLHDPVTGKEVARKVSWPEPYRYLNLPAESTANVTVAGDTATIVCGSYPLKGVFAHVAEDDGDDPDWEDNMYDLMPGETIVLVGKGLNGREVRLRHLANVE
ncbi:hypothetical protein FE257_005997 [Aspergillus nanangensis]|uniref:Beta-mannosidase B n=1 Tax=Aspergillus nanangensis TaxID=2582783 RepID=A0AAD4CPL3_ASPNN|nr:hypothetical protein FE257_005997 [Aspergillus nanangensis]